MSDKFQFPVAPEKLWQAINPWTLMNRGAQFGLVNISLGQTPRCERRGGTGAEPDSGTRTP